MSLSPPDLIDRLVETATPYTLAVHVPYVVALTAVAAEVAWLARVDGPSRRRVLLSAATAATMAAGALAVAVPYTAAFRVLWDALATLRWEGAARFWAGHPVVGAAAAFVAWDLSGWLYHLIGHRTRIGWAAHQPHHSGPDFDATLGLRQSWVPFHGLVHHPLLALAGFDLRVIFVCAAVSNCWQVLEHTSLPVAFPRWFSAVVMTPAAHRHHHRRDGQPVNLGPFFTIWDRLAGTWVPAEGPAPTSYGLATPPSSNPISVELAGWWQLLRRAGVPQVSKHLRVLRDAGLVEAGRRAAPPLPAPGGAAGRARRLVGPLPAVLSRPARLPRGPPDHRSHRPPPPTTDPNRRATVTDPFSPTATASSSASSGPSRHHRPGCGRR